MTRTDAIIEMFESLGVTIVDVLRHTIDFTVEDADADLIHEIVKALPILGATLEYDKYGDFEGGRIAVKDPANPPRA